MDAETIHDEARALGDPTRFNLFRYIVDADHPVGVAELTKYIGLNHNAVRQHLAVLRNASLVTEMTEERLTPGRPRLLYALHPEAAGKWNTSGPYAWLAGALSDALENGWDPRTAGREQGLVKRRRFLESADATVALEEELRRGGFRPTRTNHGRRIDFVLGRCPFEDVAAENPSVVCQLHLGLAEGLSESIGGFSVERLSPKNPYRAGCRLVVRSDTTPS